MALLSIGIGLVIWQQLSLAVNLPTLFPSATQTLAELIRGIVVGTLLQDAAISILRVIAGFLAGSALGIVAGIAMGRIAVVRWLLEPYVHFFRAIPALAWLGVLVIWLGTGEATRFVLIIDAVIFIVLLNVLAGVYAVPEEQLRAAAVFGASRRQELFLIVLPACVPYAIEGMRLALGKAFIALITTEMLGSNSGLGFQILSGMSFGNSRIIFAVILILGVLGWSLDMVIRMIADRFGGRFVGDTLSVQ